MEIKMTPRATGKTLDCIERSAKTGACIVCATDSMVRQIMTDSKELGYNIRPPITASEFREGRYYGAGIGSFIIDNAELVLSAISRVPIDMITLTDTMGEK